ncbi:MAG: phosphoadenylyl-sulfate reductase [Geminicoccaceae bacterium]|nr:phosphoadenylyl-sulfate reductase [Geminicoccaceae bacterium]
MHPFTPQNPSSSPFDRLAREAAGLDGMMLIRQALTGALRGRVALVASFGAESAVLLDMVASVDPATPVLFLDTGKLFPETLRYQEEICAGLGLLDVRRLTPDASDLRRHDPEGDLHAREPDVCCNVRKTEPLERGLEGFDAWITGRKRFHGGLRADLEPVEAEPETGRVKINPLAGWSAEDIRHYRRLRGLPLHPLVVKGYASIGCEPCTSPVGSGEAPRAGRWRGLDKQECGIHVPKANVLQ